MTEKAKFALPPAVQVQALAMLKAAMISAGTALLVQKGWLSNEQLQEAVGYLLGLGGLAWVAWRNRPQGVINTAAQLDQVKSIETTTQKAADAAPDNVKGPVDVLKASTHNEPRSE